MSIFFDEWRTCLQEHYRYVLKTQDWVTEKTLREVLMKVGEFSEEEIVMLQEEILGEDAARFHTPVVVEEMIEEDEFVDEETPFIAAEMPSEENTVLEEATPQEPEPPPPPKIQQRSLF